MGVGVGVEHRRVEVAEVVDVEEAVDAEAKVVAAELNEPAYPLICCSCCCGRCS